MTGKSLALVSGLACSLGLVGLVLLSAPSEWKQGGGTVAQGEGKPKPGKGGALAIPEGKPGAAGKPVPEGYTEVALDPDDPKAGWVEGQEWEGTSEEAARRAKAKGKGRPMVPLGLPEGMTQEEQDAIVAEAVAAYDWETGVAAWQASMGRRGVSLRQKRAIGDMFEVFRELRGVGVAHDDPRVARAFVPAWVGALSGELSEAQLEQVAAVVDEVVEPVEDPAEEPTEEGALPVRYARVQAAEVRETRALEQRLETILEPEQLAAYLDEVGDDPFASGLALKTNRIRCEGQTVPELSEEVTELWMLAFKLPEEDRSRANGLAYRLASQVLSAAPLPDRSEAFRWRQALLERAEEALVWQADAERELLLGLTGTAEEREARFRMQCAAMEFER